MHLCRYWVASQKRGLVSTLRQWDQQVSGAAEGVHVCPRVHRSLWPWQVSTLHSQGAQLVNSVACGGFRV